MNKVIFLLVLMLTMANTLWPQCEVDAGENQNVCLEDWPNNPQLSGSVISGDIVQTKWEAAYHIQFLNTRLSVYASDLLNDTTILEPIIKGAEALTHTFFLTGISANGETCRDSVVINFSSWTLLTIDKRTGKQPLDTIQLWSTAYGEWSPLQYAWTPNYMISDTTVEHPHVWNDTTVFYKLTLTDALGCSLIDDIFEVYVVPTSTDKIHFIELKIYPNPTASQLNIDTDNLIDFVEFYNESGQYLGRQTGSPTLDLSSYSKGYLWLKIRFKNGQIATRKVLKTRN